MKEEYIPMYNIYDALKSGQTPEEIAQKFVEELNTAIQKQDADRAAAEQAAVQRNKDTEALVDHVNNYLKLYYPTVQTFHAKELEAMFDGAAQIQEIVENSVDDQEFTEAITGFFKKFGI